MRPVEFIRRARQKLDIQRADVDDPMRRVLDSVYKYPGAGGVGHLSDLLDRIDRPNGIGSIPDRDQFRFLIQGCFQSVQPELAGLNIKIDPLNIDAGIRGDQSPRGDIGVVIKAGNHDRIAF